MPKVYLIDNPQPNAFATGRNPENAAVAASTGLLQCADPEEVAGVMAHELAHVQNRDTLTMTMTATLAGAISMLGNFAFFFGGRRDNNNPLGFIGVLVAMIVAPLAAMLVQMAISRTREYSADRRGAEICGKPLCARLGARQDRRRRRIRFQTRRPKRNPATAHMFIINPLSGERMDNLFSTHPDTENRIAALQRDGAAWRRWRRPYQSMSSDFGSTGPVRADNPVRKSRSVPQQAGVAVVPQPPKGPWS